MGQKQSGGVLAFEDMYRKYSVHKEEGERGLWRLTSLDSQRSFVMKEMRLTDNGAMKSEQDRLQAMVQLAHDNFLSAVEYYIEEDKSFCSASFRIGIVFETVDLSLQEEIASRLDEGKPFEERELWSILCSAVVALCHLSLSGFSHLALSPEALYITDDGQVKLADPELVELLASPQHAYRSPQSLREESDPQQNDVFALGMTMLHTALLDPCHDCYFNTSTNQQLLNFKIKKLSRQYSQEFCAFIAELLTRDPAKRPRLPDVEAGLNSLFSTLEGINNSISVSKLPDDNQEDNTRGAASLLADFPDLPSEIDGCHVCRPPNTDEKHSRFQSRQQSPREATKKARGGAAYAEEYVRISQIIEHKDSSLQNKMAEAQDKLKGFSFAKWQSSKPSLLKTFGANGLLEQQGKFGRFDFYETKAKEPDYSSKNVVFMEEVSKDVKDVKGGSLIQAQRSKVNLQQNGKAYDKLNYGWAQGKQNASFELLKNNRQSLQQEAKRFVQQQKHDLPKKYAADQYTTVRRATDQKGEFGQLMMNKFGSRDRRQQETIIRKESYKNIQMARSQKDGISDKDLSIKQSVLCDNYGPVAKANFEMALPPLRTLPERQFTFTQEAILSQSTFKQRNLPNKLVTQESGQKSRSSLLKNKENLPSEQTFKKVGSGTQFVGLQSQRKKWSLAEMELIEPRPETIETKQWRQTRTEGVSTGAEYSWRPSNGMNSHEGKIVSGGKINCQFSQEQWKNVANAGIGSAQPGKLTTEHSAGKNLVSDGAFSRLPTAGLTAVGEINGEGYPMAKKASSDWDFSSGSNLGIIQVRPGLGDLAFSQYRTYQTTVTGFQAANKTLIHPPLQIAAQTSGTRVSARGSSGTNNLGSEVQGGFLGAIDYQSLLNGSKLTAGVSNSRMAGAGQSKEIAIAITKTTNEAGRDQTSPINLLSAIGGRQRVQGTQWGDYGVGSSSRYFESAAESAPGTDSYTDPKLLEMIARDLMRIKQSRVESG